MNLGQVERLTAARKGGGQAGLQLTVEPPQVGPMRDLGVGASGLSANELLTIVSKGPSRDPFVDATSPAAGGAVAAQVGKLRGQAIGNTWSETVGRLAASSSLEVRLKSGLYVGVTTAGRISLSAFFAGSFAK